MKKIHLLSGMIALGVIAGISAKTIGTGQLSVEEVQRRKLARQKELARKPVYAMLDALIVDQQGMYYSWTIKPTIDWSAVFHILDSMKNVISVNDYTTPDNLEYTLLDIAVEKNNLLAAKTLLEKYKADPNKGEVSALMIACENGNIEMVNLILKHGGNPNVQDKYGKTSFGYAKTQPKVLNLLYKHTSPAKAA